MHGSRLLPLALLISVALLGSGCFVLDELEAGEAILDAHTPADKKKEREQAAAKKAGSQGAEAPPSYQESVSGWFENARTLSTGPGGDEGEDPVVSCRHGGQSLFTRRSDCLARGGEPG